MKINKPARKKNETVLKNNNKKACQNKERNILGNYGMNRLFISVTFKVIRELSKVTLPAPMGI